MRRKLNKRQKLLRNLALMVAMTLLYLLLTGSQGYLTADQAHAASEMTLNYGPSQIVQIVSLDNCRYYLGKYDRWFSCHPVYWTVTGWHFGSQNLCDEIDPNEDINYGWFVSNGQGRIWGVVNNPQIVSVEVELSDGVHTLFLRQDQLYQDMFLLFYQENSLGEEIGSHMESSDWEGAITDYAVKAVRGYDRDGKLVYTQVR